MSLEPTPLDDAPASQTDRAGKSISHASRMALFSTILGLAALGPDSKGLMGLEISAATTLPPGSVLYLRLEKSVSTQTSHLREELTARVVREVPAQPGGSDVAIPVGAIARGSIDKLIPNSSPTDRARLRLRFTYLEIPGQSPLSLAARVVEVENARETVLPDATIQGILASELPMTMLENALDKLKKSSPDFGAQAKKVEEQALGKAETSIEFPAGTDIRVLLDGPVVLERSFPPAVSGRLPEEVGRLINHLLMEAPQRATDKDGKPGDPLNLVVVGSMGEFRRVFHEAGWTEAERLSGKSLWETVRAVMANKGYGSAPVSELFLFGRPEDLAFQKMLNTFAQRHHLRLWRSAATRSDGREIWLGAATHDVGWDIRPGVVSHAIDPEIDNEREKVAADLAATGRVACLRLVTRPNPLSEGLTATGAPWRTDGRLLLIELKPW